VSRIIFTNQKGGVGKTTLTREVGITLSELGMRVLLVDCDPQGNLSKSFEVEASGLYDGLTGGEAIVHHINNRLALLPGNLSLSLLEKRLLGEIDAYERLGIFWIPRSSASTTSSFSILRHPWGYSPSII
jgi:chromosome partitioning protein